MDGTMLEDSNRKNEVERSGFSFYSLGRKSWVHFLMVLVLIFVQSTDNFALGKEIKVDEEGSLVDLTVQNQGRNLVSSFLFNTMPMQKYFLLIQSFHDQGEV